MTCSGRRLPDPQQPAIPDLAGDRDRPQPHGEEAGRGHRNGAEGPLVRRARRDGHAPYDRLIGAALNGNRVLFARQDTVEAAWRVIDAVLGDAVPVHPYPRGSWGPKEADGLLPDGDTWHDPAG